MANVMNRFLGIALFVLACALVATPACYGAGSKAITKGGKLQIEAEGVEFDPATGVAKAKGTAGKQVRVEYEGMTLDADEIMLNHKTKDVAAKGNVIFVNGDQVWKGNAFSGNFGSRTFSCGVFDLKAGVWYGHADHAERQADGTSEVINPRISTCDYEHPHYSISAKRIVYYPNGKFRAYHTVYRVGNVPVFYWPLLLGDTTAQGGNIEIKPGYASDWGAYLLLSRSHRIGDFGRTKFMLDLRSKNGIAIGNQTRLKLARAETDFLVYGMYDMDTPETSDGYNRRFESEDIRYRLSLYQRVDFSRDLTFRGQVNAFSDIDMFEDWFRKEYDLNPQPYSYLDLTWDTEAFSLSLAARPKVNSFYTAVEQLPELHLLVPRQSIFGSRVYYQSDLTFGHYTMDWREFDEPNGGGTDPLNAESYDSWRANWVNMLYAPFAAGEFQFVPRAGFQVAWYSDSSETALTDPMLRRLYEHDNPNRLSYLPDSSLDEYDDMGGGTTNFAGELGLEVSTKLYRTWQNYKNGTLDADGLRHVVQPYINYTYVSDPSEDPENLYYFDQNDRLAEMNFLRVGVNQRLQTRRHGKIYTMARMQTYADFHFNKQKYYSPDACIEDTEPDAEHGELGDLANRIDFQPREGLGFWNTIVFDMDEGDLSRAELGMSIGKDPNRQFTLAYIYRNDYVPRALYSMGSSLLDFTGENNLYAQPLSEAQWVKTQLTLPINAKTTGRVTLAYDFVDSALAHNSLELIRDLHCWLGTLAIGQDNGDFFVSVMLTLKAFPGMGVGGGI